MMTCAGSEKEREVYRYALTRCEEGKVVNGETEDNKIPPPAKVSIRFEEVQNGNYVAMLGHSLSPKCCLCITASYCAVLQVYKPVDGKDVSLKLVLSSDSSVPRPLSINISVQAVRYNGQPAVNIQTEKTEQTLLPGKGDAVSVYTEMLPWYRENRL